MNYFVRCLPPVCIEDEARHFDQRMLGAAMNKLGPDEGEQTEETATQLQLKLLEGGGWGLTAAARTSPAAFLGSLATCHSESIFTLNWGTTALPPSSLLHGWIDDSLQRVRRAAPGDDYQTDIELPLPATADDFFSYCKAAEPSVTSKLKHKLNAKATSCNVADAVVSMKERLRQGERWQWAHRKAISANGAWNWKLAKPDGPHLRLSDVEYAIAARLNLGLQLSLPTQWRQCRSTAHCAQRTTGEPVSLRDDPWHWLCAWVRNC